MCKIGCGQHIEQALAGLKDEEICKCKEEAKADKQQQEVVPTLVKLN